MFETFRVDRPYPGLRPFEAWESSIFFGRESHTGKLLEVLDEHQFLVVTGPSGSGKSSLVRAGLIPSLHLGTLGRGGTWKLALMRPGDRPLRELAQALLGSEAFGSARPAADAVSGSAEGAGLSEQAYLLAELSRGRRGLADWVRDRRAQVRDKQAADDFDVLLLVDQFEEIFTYAKAGGRSANEAEAFVNLLLSAAQDRDSGIYVVLTMRTDFLGACTRFPDLPEMINRAGYLTPRLSRPQLEQAISAPARVFGGDLETALTTELVNAVSQDPDQLPVLQHALARMWDCRCLVDKTPPVLHVDDLKAVGGIDEALSRHAGEVLRELQGDPAQPQAEAVLLRAQWLFRALSERRGAEAGGQLVRHPQSLALIEQASGIPWQDFVPLLKAFAQPEVSFLTYPGQPGEPANGAATVVDISHEALLRQWTQLADWLAAEARAAAELRELLRRTALKDALLTGPDLARALDWQQRGLGLRRLASEALAFGEPSAGWAQRYCDAGSYAAVTQLIADSQVELQRQTRKALRVTWTLRAGAVLLCVLGTASGAFGYWAYRQTLDASALALWNRLRFDEVDSGGGSEDLMQSVQQLARSDRELRRVSARKWLDDEALARQIPRSGGLILRAALGLDSELRDELVERIVSGAATAPPALQAPTAYALMTLDATARPDLVFRGLTSGNDPYAFQVGALASYFARLSPEAVRTFKVGLADMTRAASAQPASQAANGELSPQGAIVAVAPLLLKTELSNEQVVTATRMVTDVLAKSQDPAATAGIATLSRLTAARLTPAQRPLYIDEVLRSAGDAQSPARVVAMAAALAPVASKLSATQMQTYVNHVVTALPRADGARGRPWWQSFLAAISASASVEQSAVVVDRAVTAVLENELRPLPETNYAQGVSLNTAIQSLSGFTHAMSAVEARRQIDRLLASAAHQRSNVMLSTRSPELAGILTHALAADAMQALASTLIAGLSKPHDGLFENQAQSMLVAGFDRLDEAQAAWVTEWMLQRAETRFAPIVTVPRRSRLSPYLSDLIGEAPRSGRQAIQATPRAQTAGEQAQRILAALSRDLYMEGENVLATRLETLAPRLEAREAQSLGLSVLQEWSKAMGSNRYTTQEWHLGVLVALCSRVPEAALSNEFVKLAADIALDATSPSQDRYADALVTLAPALGDAQASRLFDRVVGELLASPNGYLGSAWQSGERLTALMVRQSPVVTQDLILSAQKARGSTRFGYVSSLLAAATGEAALQLPAAARPALARQLLQQADGPEGIVVRSGAIALASRLADSAQLRPEEIKTWLELAKSPFAERDGIVRAIRQVERGGPAPAEGDWAYLRWAAQQYGVDVRAPMRLDLSPGR